MISKTNKSQCSGCSACEAVCALGCITMKADKEGFLYPVVDETRCAHCGKCDTVCPAENPILKSIHEAIAWGANAKDEKLRLESSSGGVFSILALNTLRNRGTVFGAALREDCRSVHHVMIEHEMDLPALRGSKYLQSDLEGIFREVKKRLQTGKPVLFSGTPCQIAGLKRYLGKEHENLLSVGIICHGVPSPKLWEKYADEAEKKLKSGIQAVSFRSKKIGWKRFGLNVITQSGRDRFMSLRDDPFLEMFLRDQCLRPSCYQCTAKDGNCGADLILGDFWGVEYVAPALDDDKGTSLVFALTEKGEQLFSEVSGDMEQIEVDGCKALQGNPAYSHSVSRPPARESFFEDLDNLSFREMQRKYLRLTPKQRVIRTLDRVNLLQPICKILGK